MITRVFKIKDPFVINNLALSLVKHINEFKDWSKINFTEKNINEYAKDNQIIASNPYELFIYTLKMGLINLPEKFKEALEVLKRVNGKVKDCKDIVLVSP